MSKIASEVKDLAEVAKNLDGIEVHKDDWNIADAVIKMHPKEYRLGNARGPDNKWKRLYYTGKD